MINSSTSARNGAIVLLLWALALLPISPAIAQSGEYMLITHPPAGDVISSGSTIYFGPGTQNVYQWRITIGTSPDIAGLYDSGVKLFDQEPWELPITGIADTGKSVTLRFWQRSDANANWVYTDTVFNTHAGGESPQSTGSAVVTFSESDVESPAPTVTESFSQNESTPARAPVNVDVNRGATASALRAVHRDGQTFLTWTEVRGDVGYHVYRHTSPITSSTIKQAEKLTSRWGALDSDTTLNKHAHGSVPTTYVIDDLGQPLSESQGLFVNTPSNSGPVYYAVTTASGNRENRSIKAGQNSLSAPVVETVAETAPVLTLSLNRGKGRLYTQYMDYANWNPTFNGYAYNYSVTLPSGYRKSRAYPLLLRPHAYGEELTVNKETEYGWQVIQIFPQDPGPSRGSIANSWWFGYAADHNYLTDGQVPKSGSIANFTEARVMKAVRDTIRDPGINVDEQLVHAFGHSMGASGSLSLGMRYGNVFAGIYGNEAMTNYTTSPVFKNEWEQLWGSESSNLPVSFQGPYTDNIAPHEGTGVWDWMNHHKQLMYRRGERMAFMMLAHGKADTIVDWATQGAPMARVFNNASVGYSAHFVEGAGHAWLGFLAVNKTLFGFGGDVNFPWRYPHALSFPAIANASGSGPLSPGSANNDSYNMDIEWATPHTLFAKSIVDRPGRYEISLRSKKGSQTADITPRNAQRFTPRPGAQCQWVAVKKRKTVGRGTVVADADGLVTIPQVLITTKGGTRLTIECS